MKIYSILYLIIQGITFITYGIDKIKAKANFYRISEKILLGLTVIGPFGAILGMIFFHHKIRKSYFKFISGFMAILHIVLLYYVLTMIH